MAELLGKPLNSAASYSNSTVDRWLSGRGPIPGFALELLELKLADRDEQPHCWQRLIRQPVPYSDQRELEADLKDVLAALERGKLPRIGRGRNLIALRRAGYWRWTVPTPSTSACDILIVSRLPGLYSRAATAG